MIIIRCNQCGTLQSLKSTENVTCTHCNTRNYFDVTEWNKPSPRNKRGNPLQLPPSDDGQEIEGHPDDGQEMET
jgi:hypothetical protein